MSAGVFIWHNQLAPAAWRYWPQSAARLSRMYAGRGSSYSWGMGELILWKQITAELNGHTVIGLYSASRDGLVTVRTPYERKSRQLVGSSAALIARILLRELAADGKA